jgi:septal ring factor EnvC (AmiA/AmiB activator)
MDHSIQDSLQRLEGKLDLAVKDFNDLKARIAEIGAPNTQAELLLAGTNSRLDLVDERLARIADKLDLLRRDLAAQAGRLESCK